MAEVDQSYGEHDIEQVPEAEAEVETIVEETRAQIKILDGAPGATARAVMLSAKEEPDSTLPPAMDGLLTYFLLENASNTESLKTEPISSTTCISDWSSIPQQLLVLILDRLVSLDYFRVSAVCKYWYRVASDHRKYWSPFNIPRHLPLLTIPSDTPDGQTLSFYGATDGKLLHSFIVPFNNRLIGSSLGWLIFIDTNLVIKLFNPFSMSPIIHLPPARIDFVSELFNPFSMTPMIHLPPAPIDFVSKVILSADPALNPHDYVVAIILHGKLAFLKPSSKKLTWSCNTPSNKFMVDVIYFNDRFHAISSSGEVYIFDGVHEYPKYNDILSNREIFRLMKQTNTYLFHSCLSGKLLLIQPFISSFIVYEIKNDGGILTWVRKLDLDDQVFFVGNNNSISVLTCDIPGCKSDSIYFTALYIPRSADQVVVSVRIYNLKDEGWEQHFVVKRIYTGRMTKVDSQRLTPTWFFPVFHKA